MEYSNQSNLETLVVFDPSLKWEFDWEDILQGVENTTQPISADIGDQIGLPDQLNIGQTEVKEEVEAPLAEDIKPRADGTKQNLQERNVLPAVETQPPKRRQRKQNLGGKHSKSTKRELFYEKDPNDPVNSSIKRQITKAKKSKAYRVNSTTKYQALFCEKEVLSQKIDKIYKYIEENHPESLDKVKQL